MKDRRKNKRKRKVLLTLYLAVCLVIIVAAYFHLSRIARNFNTEHLELITEDITLYAHWQWNGEGPEPDPDPVPDEPVIDGGDGSGFGAVLARADRNAQLVENHPHIVGMHPLDIEREDGAFAGRRAVNPQAVDRRETFGSGCDKNGV